MHGPASVPHPFTFSKRFSSETACVIKPNIVCGVSLGRENEKVCSQHLGHMTKMAAKLL